MIFSWLTRRRRRRLLAEPFPAAWLSYLGDNVRHYECLEPCQQAIAQKVVQVFVAEKHWAGGGGLSVTDEMKVTVAAQASLLVLGFPEIYCYDHVPSIIVYPRKYVRPRRIQEQYHLIVREDWELSGEAWYRGPIVLSWEAVLAGGRNASAGHNLVLHEFAHHLDALNGDFDGTPPLSSHQQQDWYRVTEAEYLRLVGSAQRNDVTLLDHYGATNRVEFFAVATECFFEHPSAMKRLHAELYDVLRDFYRQNPAQWCPDASLPPDRQPMARTDSRDVDKTDPVRESE
jgi:MtfA peptidase